MTARILVVDDSPTLRRVVSGILERHEFEVFVAEDGDDALVALREGPRAADLILLDFVMPRMNGYQFCRALRADPALAGIPVVLMSARSDRIRDQFVQQTGAIDAIAKPFDAEALVAVVENALRRIDVGFASPPRVMDLDPDEPRSVAPPDLEQEAPISRVLRDARGEPALSGDLAVLPIGAILQLLQLESQTGVLLCRSGTADVVATFRKGLIDLVQSSGAGDEFRLGRYFVEEGIVTPAEIDDLMARVHALHASDVLSGNTERPLLGAVLLASGKVSEEQLRTALERQSSELLYEVLRWPIGRFEFRVEPANEIAKRAQLGLPVVSVVMEGFRRVDEWRVLERTLGSFDAVLVRDDLALCTIDANALPAKERFVLEAVDGERAVRAIIAASHLSSFDACRALVQFLEARALRRKTAIE